MNTITRETAWGLLTKYNKESFHQHHAVAGRTLHQSPGASGGNPGAGGNGPRHLQPRLRPLLRRPAGV